MQTQRQRTGLADNQRLEALLSGASVKLGALLSQDPMDDDSDDDLSSQESTSFGGLDQHPIRDIHCEDKPDLNSVCELSDSDDVTTVDSDDGSAVDSDDESTVGSEDESTVGSDDERTVGWDDGSTVGSDDERTVGSEDESSDDVEPDAQSDILRQLSNAPLDTELTIGDVRVMRSFVGDAVEMVCIMHDGVRAPRADNGPPCESQSFLPY